MKFVFASFDNNGLAVRLSNKEWMHECLFGFGAGYLDQEFCICVHFIVQTLCQWCSTELNLFMMSLRGSLVCGSCGHLAVNLGDAVGSNNGCQRLRDQHYGRCTREENLWFQYGSVPAKNWEGHFYCYKCAPPGPLLKAQNKTKNFNWGRPCEWCKRLGACWRLGSGEWLEGWNMIEAIASVESQPPPVPFLALTDAPHPAPPPAANAPPVTVQPIPSTVVPTCPAEFAGNWGASASSSHRVPALTRAVQQHDGNNAEVDSLRKEVSVFKMKLEMIMKAWPQEFQRQAQVWTAAFGWLERNGKNKDGRNSTWKQWAG